MGERTTFYITLTFLTELLSILIIFSFVRNVIVLFENFGKVAIEAEIG